MPHFKPTILKLLAALIPLFAALPATAAADKVVDATKAGVVGDGTTMNTAAIQKVIVGTTLLKSDARPATVFIDVEGLKLANFAAESSIR